MQSFSDQASPPPDIRWLSLHHGSPAPKALRVLVASDCSGIVRQPCILSIPFGKRDLFTMGRKSQGGVAYW